MPPAKEKTDLDLWGRISALPEAKRGEYRVEIDRVTPEYDPETGEQLAGFVKEMPLTEFTRERMYQLLGGGTYQVTVREKKTGTYFARETVAFAGVHKKTAPPSFLDPSRTHSAPGEPYAPGRPVSYEEVYKQVRRDIDEERRREEEREERRATREALGRLHEVLSKPNGNGNGHGRHDVLETIEAIGKLKDVLGLAGKGGGLDGIKLIELLDKREMRGEQRAKEFFNLLKESGADPDGLLETKFLDVFGDMIREGRREKAFEQAAESMSKSAKPAQEILEQIKSGIAELLEKHFGSQGALGAMPVRGARSVSELLVAIDDLLLNFSGDDSAGEKEQDGPGEASGVGSPGPGKQD